MFFSYFRWPILAYLAFIVLIASLFAEEKVFRSAVELTEHAAVHAPDLIQAKFELAATVGARKQSVLGINPVLSGDLGYKEIKTSAGTTTGQGLYYGAGLDFNFEFPSKPIFRKAIAEKNLSLASNALLQMEREVRSRSLGGLWRVESLRKSLREMTRIRDRHESLIRAFAGKASSGSVSILENLSLETSGLEWDERIRQTAVSLSGSESELGRLLGLPGDTVVRLETTTVEALFPDWSEMEVSSLTNDPASRHVPFIVKKLLHESARLQTRLARAEGVPDLGLGPVFSGENAGGSETAFGGKISFPIPVFNANQGRVAELSAREKIAESQAASARQDALRDLRRLAEIVTRLMEQEKRLSPENVRRFKDAADLAGRDVRVGVIPVPLYLEVARGYGNALAARSEALSLAWEIHAEIQALFLK